MRHDEIEILREVAGEIPPSPWNDWLGINIKRLQDQGYIDRAHRLTDKGRGELARFHRSSGSRRAANG